MFSRGGEKNARLRRQGLNPEKQSTDTLQKGREIDRKDTMKGSLKSNYVQKIHTHLLQFSSMTAFPFKERGKMARWLGNLWGGNYCTNHTCMYLYLCMYQLCRALGSGSPFARWGGWLNGKVFMYPSFAYLYRYMYVCTLLAYSVHLE